MTDSTTPCDICGDALDHPPIVLKAACYGEVEVGWVCKRCLRGLCDGLHDADEFADHADHVVDAVLPDDPDGKHYVERNVEKIAASVSDVSAGDLSGTGVGVAPIKPGQMSIKSRRAASIAAYLDVPFDLDDFDEAVDTAARGVGSGDYARDEYLPRVLGRLDAVEHPEIDSVFVGKQRPGGDGADA